jgi:hypothetical protein
MNFIQFLFPDGRIKAESIDMPPEIEALAKELNDAGWCFEIECFPGSQLVHADCCDDEESLAEEQELNGPRIPEMVERLVRDAHTEWIKRGRVPAQGGRLGKMRRRLHEEYES